MKLFLDTANLEEIEKYLYIIDGITLNPTLIAKENRNVDDVIHEICNIGMCIPINIEVISSDTKSIIKEAVEYSKINENIVVKIPVSNDGLKAVLKLSGKGVKTNVTLVFTVSQALLAAKTGADYVSIFVGRLDDNGIDGMQVVSDTKKVFLNYNIDTKIITASIRSIEHVERAAKYGSDIATIPSQILSLMFKNELTEVGIKKFVEDYEKIK